AEPGDAGYLGQAMLARNVLAVTAACLAIRRDVFLEAGGFDAENLPVAFNDVDLCLRLRELGYRVVWTPHARLVHAELSTRGADETGAKAARAQREQAYLRRTWGPWLDDDPFLSPHLLRSEFAARITPCRRTPPSWRA
ncbi:MAG TPA: glycosyltransferase, partial [Stellaceae bacterium]|nr:glycosyltransferase [Stellaceae bacterium]